MIMANKKHKLSLAQKITIAIIIIVMIITFGFTIASFFLQPENLTKAKISGLAADYYENYLYENLLNSENFSGDVESTLSEFKDTGLSTISLRQLLLHDRTKNASVIEEIKQYCDEEKTTIKFYPEAPYSRTNYHTDYHYVCNF
jgi:hypothetical protein